MATRGHHHTCSVSRLDGLIGSQVELHNGSLVLFVLSNEGSCFHPLRERVLTTVALRIFIALCSKKMTFSKTFGYRLPYNQAVNSEY